MYTYHSFSINKHVCFNFRFIISLCLLPPFPALPPAGSVTLSLLVPELLEVLHLGVFPALFEDLVAAFNLATAWFTTR